MTHMWQKTPRDQMDLAVSIARRSLRYWWVAAVPALLGAAGALGIGMIRGRTYESRTVIMYRELVPMRILQGSDSSNGERNMITRIQDLAMSRPILAKLQRDRHLFDNVAREEGVDEAIEDIRERIKFKVRGAGTFHLSYFGDTPEQARDVATHLADLLIDAERKFQREEIDATQGLLGKERERTESDLHDKEQALARFLARHPEFAEETQAGLAGASGASIRARTQAGKGDSLKDPKLLALERQRDRLRDRISGRVSSRGAAVSAGTGEQDLKDARRAVDDTRRRHEEMRAQFMDQHPDVVAAKGQYDRAKARLETLRRADSPRVAAPSPVDPVERARLAAELDRLDEQIQRHEQREQTRPAKDSGASRVVELETEWARLAREVEEARERQQAIVGKSFATDIASSAGLAGDGAQMVILDPASRPTRPAGLGLRLLALAGLFLFGGLGAALAFGLGLADDRITGDSDLARFGIGRAIAVVPRRRRRLRRGRGE